MLARIAALTSALTILAAAAPPARACGGFFCNAQTLSPIYQAGERVLFARHGDVTTVHIEVLYEGEPTSFGWLLPLVAPPSAADGQPLALDQVLSLSSQRLFPTLQALTDPQFVVQNTWSDDACRNFPSPGGWADSSSAIEDASADSGDAPTPPVTVLQEAEVGPYAAQLIQATSSDALLTWLGDNGYVQDPAAKPHLGYYVGMGYVFLGLRLQTGKSTGDLRPIALTLGETAPCVPLKLTSIAATPGMPVLVWVLGAGRAVPKNFIHAVVNDAAIQFPGGANYVQVVEQAVDAGAGRAWVTETAMPTDGFRGLWLSDAAAVRSALASAGSLTEVYAALPSALRTGPDAATFFMSAVPMPSGLKGYPHGDCFHGRGPGWSDACSESNDEHVTTEAEFYNFLDYWLAQADAGAITLEVELASFKARVEAEILSPLEGIEALFAKTSTLTRFFTTLDPSEMTRDPIFAFNDALPMVDRRHVVSTVVGSDADCSESWVDATWADGTKARFDCDAGCFGSPTVGPAPGAPALRVLEVLDETGAPVAFAESQAEEVDALLDFAVVGQPSLPATFEPVPPTPPNPALGDLGGADVSKTDAAPAASTPDRSTGCGGAGAGAGIPTWLAMLVGGVWVRRRRT